MQQKRRSNQDMQEEGTRKSREQEREKVEQREERRARLQERLLQVDEVGVSWKERKGKREEGRRG